MDRLAGEGGSRRLFGMLDRVRGRLESGDSRSAVLGLIFLEWLGNPGLNGGRYAIQIGDAWRSVADRAGDALDLEIDLLGQKHPEWAGVVPQVYRRLDDRTLHDLHQQVHATLVEASPGELFDAVLELAAAREGARGGEFASPISLRILLAELAAPQHGAVLDPAAGVGGLLTESAWFARRHGGQVRLLGQELNDATWAIAKMRLAVHGYDADIRRGDSFRSDAFQGLAADNVLTVPPFNQKLSLDFAALGTDVDDRRWRFGVPSPSDASLAWVQHALAHVAPGGRAFVVLAPSAGTRRTGA
jgi:type I restriction enzyme M protein